MKGSKYMPLWFMVDITNLSYYLFPLNLGIVIDVVLLADSISWLELVY